MRVPSNDSNLSALPSTAARIVAFVSIIIGGVAGGLIGYAVVKVSSSSTAYTALGIGTFVGAALCAGGTAIVAVLVLRASGEWREISDRSK